MQSGIPRIVKWVLVLWTVASCSRGALCVSTHGLFLHHSFPLAPGLVHEGPQTCLPRKPQRVQMLLVALVLVYSVMLWLGPTVAWYLRPPDSSPAGQPA